MYILECIFQWADRKFSFRIFFPMTFVLCHFMIWASMYATKTQGEYELMKILNQKNLVLTNFLKI